ncbi:hypothetical protein C8R46DRAFT_1024464 [Mycena filopes]|nr:hypothetical protein C8R46DRAFT_1024464 [Mycena filopes]
MKKWLTLRELVLASIRRAVEFNAVAANINPGSVTTHLVARTYQSFGRVGTGSRVLVLPFVAWFRFNISSSSSTLPLRDTAAVLPGKQLAPGERASEAITKLIASVMSEAELIDVLAQMKAFAFTHHNKRTNFCPIIRK